MQIQNNQAVALLQRYGNSLITAVCAVAAVWFAAQLTWQLITPRAEVPTGPIRQPASASSNVAPSISGLVRLQLFGSAEVKQQQQVAAQNAPKTTLNVRLLGVSASSNPARSAAIIERTGKQEVYVVGEKLSGTQVGIHEIYADRVILDNNGRLETLELEGIGELSEGLSLTMANMQRNNNQAGANVAAGPVAGGLPPTATDRGVPAIDPGPQLEGAAQAKAQALLTFIRIAPVREGSGLKGYRLSPGANPALFNQAGFKSGDLAVAINGQDLTNIATAIKLTNELATMTAATVTVVRGTEYIDLRLDINDLPQGEE